MNDINWKELYELYYKLYYKLLADYFILHAALRQTLSIYDGEVADKEKADAALPKARRLLYKDQLETTIAAFCHARRLLDREQMEGKNSALRNARCLLDRERDEPLPFTDWTPEEVSE